MIIFCIVHCHEYKLVTVFKTSLDCCLNFYGHYALLVFSILVFDVSQNCQSCLYKKFSSILSSILFGFICIIWKMVNVNRLQFERSKCVF